MPFGVAFSADLRGFPPKWVSNLSKFEAERACTATPFFSIAVRTDLDRKTGPAGCQLGANGEPIGCQMKFQSLALDLVLDSGAIWVLIGSLLGAIWVPFKY